MHSLAVVSIHIGRQECFAAWSAWLAGVSLPCPTSLYLVDNSGDASFGSLLTRMTDKLQATNSFQAHTVLHSPGPASVQDRSGTERYRNTARALTLACEKTSEDLVFIVDDDTIPAPDCLEKLVEEYHRTTEHEGEEPVGAIAGCYESARAPGFLVAARSHDNWTNRPRVGELGENEIINVGLVGNGCILIRGALLRGMLPLVPSHGGTGGPDGYICAQLREAGFRILLHGGVQCRHLFRACS